MTATISDVHTQQPKQGRVQTSKRVILDGLFGYFKSSKNVFEKTFIITLFFIALLCFSNVPCWSESDEKTKEEFFPHGTI